MNPLEILAILGEDTRLISILRYGSSSGSCLCIKRKVAPVSWKTWGQLGHLVGDTCSSVVIVRVIPLYFRFSFRTLGEVATLDVLMAVRLALTNDV